jgi:hypothetical protein
MLESNRLALHHDVANKVLDGVAANCDDKLTSFLFEKIQEVSMLAWPMNNNPFVTAIKHNKVNLMRAMSRVYAPSDDDVLIAANDDNVSLATINVLVRECGAPIISCGPTNNDSKLSDAMYGKIELLKLFINDMPQNAQWRYAMFSKVVAGEKELVAKYPQAFTVDSLASWASQGNGKSVLSILAFLLAYKHENAAGLVTALLNSVREKLVSDIDSSIQKGEPYQAVVNLFLGAAGYLALKKGQADHSAIINLLALVLDRINIKEKYDEKIVPVYEKRCGGELKGFKLIITLLLAGQVPLALRLCQDFGANVNEVEPVGAFTQDHSDGKWVHEIYHGKTQLEVALMHDGVDKDTFVEWLKKAPVLKFELPTVKAENLSELAREKFFAYVTEKLFPSDDSKLTSGELDLLTYVVAKRFEKTMWDDSLSGFDYKFLLNRGAYSVIWQSILHFNKVQRETISTHISQKNSKLLTKEVKKIVLFCELTTEKPKDEKIEDFLKRVISPFKSQLKDGELLDVIKKAAQQNLAQDLSNLDFLDVLLCLKGGFVPVLIQNRLAASVTSSESAAVMPALVSAQERQMVNGVFNYLRYDVHVITDENLEAAKFKTIAVIFAI